MTDLEMTKLCADAMSWSVTEHPTIGKVHFDLRELGHFFDPLTEDVQAMALVKEFRIRIDWWPNKRCKVEIGLPPYLYEAEGIDLNRAIVECVAKMQVAKEAK